MRWGLFLPHIGRLAPVSDEPRRCAKHWIEGDSDEIRRGGNCIPHALVQLVIETGKVLAKSDSDGYWTRTEELRDHTSPVVQYILIETYASLDAGRASEAIDWLIADWNWAK